MLELEPVKQLSGKPAILVLGRSDKLCYVALSCCALYGIMHTAYDHLLWDRILSNCLKTHNFQSHLRRILFGRHGKSCTTF